LFWCDPNMPHELISQLAARVESAAQPETARIEFGRLCHFVIAAVEMEALTVQQAAYRICGTALRIPEPLSPEERHLVTVAGNLELPVDQRDPSLPGWNGLKEIVAKLFLGS
jgi:hypothetical protein